MVIPKELATIAWPKKYIEKTLEIQKNRYVFTTPECNLEWLLSCLVIRNKKAPEFFSGACMKTEQE